MKRLLICAVVTAVAVGLFAVVHLTRRDDPNLRFARRLRVNIYEDSTGTYETESFHASSLSIGQCIAKARLAAAQVGLPESFESDGEVCVFADPTGATELEVTVEPGGPAIYYFKRTSKVIVLLDILLSHLT